MNARRRSVADAAYAPSEEDGLPNALSAIVQSSRPFGSSSATPQYFWTVVTWWIKFGAAQFGGSVPRSLAALPADRFTRPRFSVTLPSGKTLSIPTALSLINPPDEPDAATRAAHTLMYSVVDYDLFDLCFRDRDLVCNTILDFDAFIEWLDLQSKRPALIALLARFVAELVIRQPAGIDVAGAERSFRAWLADRLHRIGAANAELAARTVSQAHGAIP